MLEIQKDLPTENNEPNELRIRDCDGGQPDIVRPFGEFARVDHAMAAARTRFMRSGPIGWKIEARPMSRAALQFRIIDQDGRLRRAQVIDAHRDRGQAQFDRELTHFVTQALRDYGAMNGR